MKSKEIENKIEVDEVYESPEVEIIEVEVEKGFAISMGGSGEPGRWG